MITFKPVVYSHHKRQDGSYNVKIRVTFRRQSRHLPTNLFATAADLTRSLKIKSPQLVNQCADLCNRMRSACDDLDVFALEGRDVDYVVAHIKDRLSSGGFRLDFFEFARTVIDGKTVSTAAAYTTAVNTFSAFLGRSSIDVNEITRATVSDLIEWIDRRGRIVRQVESDRPKKQGRQAAAVIGKLRYVYNAAKRRYNDEDSGKIPIPRSPFDNHEIRTAPTEGQRSLGVEIMQKIISARADTAEERKALDAFVVSFGLMGANMADLLTAPEPRDGVWAYQRKKTRGRREDHAEMRVAVPDELRPFIVRLSGPTGWLADLRRLTSATQCVNYHFKRWACRNGVEPFTFYAARHTWATLARKAGVEKATVDECLAHVGDFRIADIYAERDWDNINRANRKVLDLFDWHQE